MATCQPILDRESLSRRIMPEIKSRNLSKRTWTTVLRALSLIGSHSVIWKTPQMDLNWIKVYKISIWVSWWALRRLLEWGMSQSGQGQPWRRQRKQLIAPIFRRLNCSTRIGLSLIGRIVRMTALSRWWRNPPKLRIFTNKKSWKR